MKSEHLRFPGARGHELAARLDAPATMPAAYALFAHCFTCSKDLKAAGWISRALVEAQGGRLWAEPSTEGAIFHFTLPLAR